MCGAVRATGVGELMMALSVSGALGPRNGSFSGQHFVENDPEAEDVASVIHLLSPRLLRRHVGDGSHDLSGIGLPTG